MQKANFLQYQDTLSPNLSSDNLKSALLNVPTWGMPSSAVNGGAMIRRVITATWRRGICLSVMCFTF